MTLREAVKERNATLEMHLHLFGEKQGNLYRVGCYGWPSHGDIYFAREDEATEFVRSYNPELHNDRNLRKT